MSDPSSDRSPRQEIEVVRRLGKGGMATVHEAVVAGRRVALKRPRHDVLSRRPEVRAHFEREYHTLAQLAHPNIIAVHGYGIDAQGPFYTMELLEGGDLAELVPMEWHAACRVLRDVAAALAMVHSRRLVHRDVSLHNVRLAASGKAKLIDFGAMTQLGVSTNAMGTPPYMAPEAVYHQALDQRTDLYALGALGYRLISGQDAYPARRIDQLRDAWRSRPRSLTERGDDIPSGLDELIRQLLSFNPASRPRTAAEVIVRLESIADLSDPSDAEIARSYLATPALVGRDAEFQALRQYILQAVRIGGSTVLVEGAAGMGRSRLLDACILDAELLGAVVVRTRAIAGAGHSFGTIAALGAELVKLRGSAASANPEIQALIARASGDAPSEAVPAPSPSEALQTELVHWLLAAAGGKTLVLIVDDVHLADMDSAAVLVRLADAAPKHRLLLVVSALEGAAGVSAQALRLLRDRAKTIALSALGEAETLALVTSLFDDVVNVRLAARRIYEIARGNPQATVDLAEWLVERSHVVHEGGRWHIPDTLSGLPLPETVDDALRQRLAALGPNAVMLGAAIAIAGDADISEADYASLFDSGGETAVQHALVELLGAMVLMPHAHGRGYGLTQAAYRGLLLELLGPDVIATLHRRIAQVCIEHQQPDWAIYHLFYGNAQSVAIDLLQVRLKQSGSPALILRSLEERVGWLREVLAFCQSEQRSAAELFAVKSELVRCAEIKASLVRQEIDELSAAFKTLTGYYEWAALPEIVDPAARITEALKAASQRHQQLPEHDRIMSPGEALPKMIEFISSCLAAATANSELSLLDKLPPLAPFAPLTDSIRLMARYIEASKATIGGRADVASAIFIEVLDELDGEIGTRLGATADRLRRHAMIAVGMLNAGLSRSIALDYSDRLAALAARTRDSYAKSTSLRIRHHYHLRRGNWRQAHHWQREVEMDKLTDRSAVFNPSGIYALSWIYATIGNVDGMRECLTQMHEYSAVSEGLQVWENYIAAEYDRLRGAADEAIPVHQKILESEAGRHMAWLYSAQGILLCYENLGEYEQGKRMGDHLLAQSVTARLDAARGLILRPLALLEARLGHFDKAVSYLEENIDRCRRYGMGGINLGIVYEFRARVAVWAHDKLSFKQYMDLCAEQYAAGGGNQELTARLDALLHEARSRGVVETSWQSRDTGAMMLTHSQVELRDRLADAVVAESRRTQALQAVALSANAAGGYLFGLTPEGIQLLASLNVKPPSRDIVGLAAHALNAPLVSRTQTQSQTQTQTQTQTMEFDTNYTRSERTTSPTHPGYRGGAATEELYPHVLVDRRTANAVGVVLLRPKAALAQSPDDAVLDIVANALLASHDVIAA